MSRRLSELLALEAISGDDRFPIRAVFHDRSNFALRQVALDVGSWLDRREVLVSTERFGVPQDETWPISMSADDLKDAPEWDHAEGWNALPPVIVGPFGYTFSPLMMAAGLAESTQRTMPPAPDNAVEADRGSERLHGLERTADLTGLDIFGPAGRIGVVRDVVFDSGLQVSALCLEDGTEMPLDRLRHRAEQGHFVFD